MRLVHAAALAGAALMLASVASAQGIGDVAAKEKEKRKTSAPAKVYTESDIGGQSVAAPTAAAEPAAGEGTATGAAASGTGGTEAKPKSDADAEKEAAERAAKEEAAWRDEMDRTRKAEEACRKAIDDLQTQLNDVSTMYTPSRARAMTALEDTKKKQAELQARLTTLEAEGHSKGYR
ncbi:MAG TPA: hypothetical protein VMX54_13855 [Vicinamibacteria bacterium]|nr:hypothetical protein [Vicinamibacteria bacterium]